MPGPLPKDPSIRQRRNKSITRATLPAGSGVRLRAPRLPAHPEGKDVEWHAMARYWWKRTWSSPMRFEYLRADEPALFRLLLLMDMYWKTPKVSVRLSIHREIRLQEREFGLTPLSRRRLEWSVAQAEEAKDKHEDKRIRRAKVIDGDPREAIDR